LGYEGKRFGSGIEKVTKGRQRDVSCGDENQPHIRAMKIW
jgi:hypothetical protein